MYFSTDTLTKAFNSLGKVEENSEGKKRLEKVSGLSYLLATSEILASRKITELNLAPSETAIRDEFKKSVAEFKELIGTGKYSSDFHHQLENNVIGSVSSNFLTTIVTQSRNQSEPKHYPSRAHNSPLLIVSKEKVSVVETVNENLKQYYNLDLIKTPLAIWLSKKLNFDSDKKISDQINSHLKGKYTSEVFECLKVSESDLIKFGIDQSDANKYLSESTANLENLIIEKPVQVISNSNTRQLSEWIQIPKPFLLLAGISGTGKSRFVREQAGHTHPDGSNLCLIPVRPDWHEPSDLLGYVSRINGEQYVASPFLKFLVKAWIEAFESAASDEITLKPLENIAAYWACLDEMNLAPVEQYFADYLAVLETREWVDDGKYKCNALVHPAQLLEENGLTGLQKVLGLEDHDGLWDYFKTHGIPIPPNLIVAGTVNMDETTHGFSRKVIDRAFTIDFGAFFPNEFDEIFEPQSQPKSLTFSRYSRANRDDLATVAADTDGSKSIAFLKEINDCLKTTPFELAYRALNELLLAVKCFAPKDALELSAVWDDFLMTKLLPRIEGDSEKLNFDGTNSLLTKLQSKVKEKLSLTGQRPDLLRTSTTGGVIDIEFRSIQKLQWMQDRLVKNNFTSFWP